MSTGLHIVPPRSRYRGRPAAHEATPAGAAAPVRSLVAGAALPTLTPPLNPQLARKHSHTADCPSGPIVTVRSWSLLLPPAATVLHFATNASTSDT
jgi:hypothetical protein